MPSLSGVLDLAGLVPGRQPKSDIRAARGRRVIGRVAGWVPSPPPIASQKILEMMVKVIILRRKSVAALL